MSRLKPIPVIAALLGAALLPSLGSAEPPLPAGLGGVPAITDEPDDTVSGPQLGLTGFWETRVGMRLQEDAGERDASLAETRLRLEADRGFGDATLRFSADLLFDGLAGDRRGIDLETGDGFVDLREANLVFSPTKNVDAKVGRQILTWGTGDFVFINDLFPKDWNAFILGRDDAYLKAPSDAIKVSAFMPWANLDLVYIPRFDADRFIDGRRVSYFAPNLGRIAGRDAIVVADRPDAWFRDDEWAVRVYRNISGYEVALYGYDGFWKSPGGVDPATGNATFPKLAVFGASLRGSFGSGIANAELGFYDSRDDPDGDDPNIRNSEFRLLLGYEQEIGRNLTLGVQYYLERMRNYDAFLSTQSVGANVPDQSRQVVTGRLTWLTASQTAEWSLFAFYSPTDRDAMIRPRVRYKVTDQWTIEAGGNIFIGEDDNSFFGQFRNNTNAYLAVRFGF